MVVRVGVKLYGTVSIVSSVVVWCVVWCAVWMWQHRSDSTYYWLLVGDRVVDKPTLPLLLNY